jgi:hypothetical protein
MDTELFEERAFLKIGAPVRIERVGRPLDLTVSIEFGGSRINQFQPHLLAVRRSLFHLRPKGCQYLRSTHEGDLECRRLAQCQRLCNRRLFTFLNPTKGRTSFSSSSFEAPVMMKSSAYRTKFTLRLGHFVLGNFSRRAASIRPRSGSPAGRDDPALRRTCFRGQELSIFQIRGLQSAHSTLKPSHVQPEICCSTSESAISRAPIISTPQY